MAVKHIDVLFTWLWEWRDGRFERKGWDYKPYRLLYQKSFEVITLIQGKDAARQWKQSLKDSFIQSHWVLPYPQNNSFMRKSKESGQVMWWSSVHRGLDLYYKELDVLDKPFPASYIKHHPLHRWGPSRPCLSHLNYTIEPEQRLLHLSESELYQHLTDFRSQWNSVGQRPSLSRRQPSRLIFEIQERIDNPFSPITGPVETWSVSTCSRMLQPALYKYEILQHRRQCFRRRRRHAMRPDYFSDTEPEVTADTDEQTSDEEGIEPQKRRVEEYIQRIEKQLYKLICQDRQRLNKPRLNGGMIKAFAPQLRRLPGHNFSILQLLQIPAEVEEEERQRRKSEKYAWVRV